MWKGSQAGDGRLVVQERRASSGGESNWKRKTLEYKKVPLNNSVTNKANQAMQETGDVTSKGSQRGIIVIVGKTRKWCGRRATRGYARLGPSGGGGGFAKGNDE